MAFADSIKDGVRAEAMLAAALSSAKSTEDPLSQWSPVAALPGPWCDWARGWHLFQAWTVTETAGIARDGEPVEVEISVPADDKFQIITQHQATELNIPKSYLGIEYSDGIVFIQVTLNQGRTTELKKKFYKRIAEDLSAELNVRKEDVFISLIEVSKENWSFGNGEMQYGPVAS